MTMTTIFTPAMMPARQPARDTRPAGRSRRRQHGRPRPQMTAQDRWMASRRADAIRNGMRRDVPLTRDEAAARQFARMGA